MSNMNGVAKMMFFQIISKFPPLGHKTAFLIRIKSILKELFFVKILENLLSNFRLRDLGLTR